MSPLQLKLLIESYADLPIPEIPGESGISLCGWLKVCWVDTYSGKSSKRRPDRIAMILAEDVSAPLPEPLQRLIGTEVRTKYDAYEIARLLADAEGVPMGTS